MKSQVVKDRPNLGSGIPVMGGAKIGKKLGGNVRSYKDVVTAKSAVELSVKKVEKRKRSEGLALREAPRVSRERIGGPALREAPHVRHGGLAQVPVIGTAVSPTDRLLCSARSQAKVVGRAADNNPKLGMLGIRMPSGLNAVEEVAPEWEEIEMAVDSGASESVVSEDMLNGVETVEGKAKKMGVQYEVADGTLIPNLGEKKYIAVSDAGVARHMKSQVCEVNKALLSVHRCVQAGNKVVFAAAGSYIEDEASGEIMPLTEKGGMYMLRLWVKAQGFGGPAGEQ